MIIRELRLTGDLLGFFATHAVFHGAPSLASRLAQIMEEAVLEKLLCCVRGCTQ